MAQFHLFKAFGSSELKRRWEVYRTVTDFLSRLEQRETDCQDEESVLITYITQQYQQVSEKRHQSFKELLRSLKHETKLILSSQESSVSPLAQKLQSQWNFLNHEVENKCISVLEFHAIRKLSEDWTEMCSRTNTELRHTYEVALLSKFSPLTQRIPVLYSTTPETRAVLEQLGPYPGRDDESQLFKWEPIVIVNAVYSGQYNQHRKAHGYGTCNWSDGSIYEGHWAGHTKDGKSRFISPDGIIYAGDWVQNNKEGFGTEWCPTGTGYTGMWLDHERHGIGSWKFKESPEDPGDFVIGEFVRGDLNGRGAYFLADGTMFVGFWEKELKHGKGMLGLPDGSMYFGNWENDKKSGTGCSIDAAGNLHRGLWQNGIMVESFEPNISSNLGDEEKHSIREE